MKFSPGRFFLGGIALLATTIAARAAEPAMAPAAAPIPEPHFVSLASFDFRRLIVAPPAKDTLEAGADLLVVRELQAWRTEEQIAWAKRTERDVIFNYAEIVGPWFTEEKLPLTAAFFKKLNDDMRAMDRAAKQPFLRPRPADADPAVRICVTPPTSTSYPSGTALQAIVWAEILTEFFPEHREAIFARAHRVAWGRVIGGVHYPSDIVAGFRLVPIYFSAARSNAAFKAGLEDCRREIAAAKR